MRPITMLRGIVHKPRHFAFASATRSGPQRARTVGSIVLVTHCVRGDALDRTVVITSLDAHVADVPPPPAAAFFPPNRRGPVAMACTDRWLAWDLADAARRAAEQEAPAAIRAQLAEDYAIVDSVHRTHASQLCVALLRAVDPLDRPAIAGSIRRVLGSAIALLEATALTRALDELGIAATDDGNRRAACENVLLPLLARAFAGNAPSGAERPSPAGIAELIVPSSVAPGSVAAAVVEAATSA